MAYCTVDDILEILPEAQVIRLTDDENSGAYDPGKVQGAIDAAAEEINSYLGGRVALPIAGAIPPILKKFNADMAAYNLYSRVAEEIPSTRKDRYDNAVKLLEKIAEGKLTLGLQPPPDAPAAADCENAAQVQTRSKIFDEKVMDRF